MINQISTDPICGVFRVGDWVREKQWNGDCFEKLGKRMGRGWARLNEDEVKQIKLGNEGQKITFMSLEEIMEADFVPRLRDFVTRNRDYFSKIIKSGDEPNKNLLDFSIVEMKEY